LILKAHTLTHTLMKAYLAKCAEEAKAAKAAAKNLVKAAAKNLVKATTRASDDDEEEKAAKVNEDEQEDDNESTADDDEEEEAAHTHTFAVLKIECLLIYYRLVYTLL
jgi:hypothetical protein